MVSELPYSDCQSLASPLEKALELLEVGNYESALQLFADVPQAQQDPTNLINQAVCLIHLGQAHEALSLCDRALSLNPNHPQAWLFKGVALHRLGHYKDAYACYDQALGKQQAARSSSLLARGRQRLKRLKSLVKHIKDAKLLRLWVN